MGKRTGEYSILVGKPEERDHLEYLDVDGRII
jgi:S-ribosylhomocysteine lyase LuxS involved in autoinducer biosynthesis